MGSIPVAGSVLSVAFVTAVDWRFKRRQDEWLTELAEAVETLRKQLGGISLETLASDDRFIDAVVSATRTVGHTHQTEKLNALRNAVLNSVADDAPDTDTQAIFLSLVDRFTPSHLRILALWDDPGAWFASHDLPRPTSSGQRTITVQAALPEMRGRDRFILLVGSDLKAAQLLGADLTGMVSDRGMMERLTTDFGRQFVRFISPPHG